MSTPESLGSMIRRVVGDYVSAHPGAELDDLIDQVVTATPSSDVERFYRQSVRTAVKDSMRLGFNAAIGAAFPAASAESHATASPKLVAIGNKWAKMKEMPHRTEFGYKRFGDCDQRDVDYIRKDLHDRQAEMNSHFDAMGARFDAVYAKMTELGADTVDDLPGLELW